MQEMLPATVLSVPAGTGGSKSKLLSRCLVPSDSIVIVIETEWLTGAWLVGDIRVAIILWLSRLLLDEEQWG